MARDKAAAVVAGKLMTNPPVTVPPTAIITEATRHMHTAGVNIIVGDFIMDPRRFFIDVVDGVVVLQGRVERSRLIPFLIRTAWRAWSGSRTG